MKVVQSQWYDRTSLTDANACISTSLLMRRLCCSALRCYHALHRFATHLLRVGVVGLVVQVTITTDPAGRVLLVNQAVAVIINACSNQC